MDELLKEIQVFMPYKVTKRYRMLIRNKKKSIVVSGYVKL